MRTAVSEQAPSDLLDLLSSPNFGLEHLVPSRLGILGLPQPEAQSSLPNDEYHTPRSRTQRWVQLPQREDQSERAHWWSEDSLHSRSHSVNQRTRAESPTRGQEQLQRRRSERPGHNSREQNRTLDQQSFWDTLRGAGSDDMSSLLESRWAATPEPSNVNPLEGNLAAKETDVVEPKGMMRSRWADTPEPEDEFEVEKPKEGKTKHGENAQDTAGGAERGTADNVLDAETRKENSDAAANGTGEVVNAQQSVNQEASVSGVPQVGREAAQESSSAQAQEMLVDQVASNALLEPPRLKKRVSWRGRSIVIAIPRFDYEAAGIPKPMSRADVEARMKHFEDQGYNVFGHDLTDDRSMGQGPAQVRNIFPLEGERRRLPSKGEIKVTLPDLEKWKRYMDRLTEQKLAALGVTLGFDEPAQSLNPDSAMSRQSSGSYPPLPFSPPLPTSSSGGMARPMGRGHSHTMSVASPVSSLGGAFGHMHRHSTFTGAPINFEHLGQQPIMSPGIPGMQSFSPQPQLGFSGVPRGGSPSQLFALRQDFGNMRGPGSPLSQQILQQTPQDYSRGLAEDQRRRQHAYSQSMQQPSLPPSFMQGSHMRLTPAALPELPEDDDEEELRDAKDIVPQAYIAPQKRVQAKTEIAVPTPRGHRHNISEGLERELIEEEQRKQDASRNYIEVTEEEERASVTLPGLNGVGKPTSLAPLLKETDPLGSNYPVKETIHSRKQSTSRFNVAAPAFTFNPGATFKPGQSEFTFGAPAVNPPATVSSNHNRHRSSGSFNVNAPAFKPTTSEFSFSTSGPAFKTDLSLSQATESKAEKDDAFEKLPAIFGKIEIPDIVKPARRSKAIPILRPDEQQSRKSVSDSATEYEDDEGRVAQGEAKRKQQRKTVDDGDDVPLFAEPTPIPVQSMPLPSTNVMGSHGVVALPALHETEGEVAEAEQDASDDSEPIGPRKDDAAPVQASVESSKQPHSHKHSRSLSALAKPFLPVKPSSTATGSVDNTSEVEFSSISDLEEGEIREDEIPLFARPQDSFTFNLSGRNASIPRVEPTFDEIDAVMQQLNAQESEDKGQQSPLRIPSPGSHPMKGVTYLAEWSRGDARSPSPQRRRVETNEDPNSVQVRQLNKAEEVPASDWSGMLSPLDEEKLHQRSHFFDDRIANLIGRALEQRLQPLEENLRSIHTTVSKRERLNALQLKRRSSNAESDADDEDDLSDEFRQRPISRGRDKRVDQIKSALLEALKEQSPTRMQTAVDIAELHSALADMKVSFARAASANLELDDIRAIVEDTITRQSQAQSQALISVAGEGEMSHKRELSELHGRLNETLAGALEEANQRRAVEERETETRRQLRLAQEELQLLRDSARDDDSKSRAMEEERKDMLDRLDQSEERCRAAEDKLEDSEAQNGALHATLEEYRMSSKKWREDIEEGKRMREELENTLSMVRRQAEDNQDSTSSMRRRLEKLHADMATACGQLASEKATWKSREEDYRAQIDLLESQRLAADRERMQVEDELRMVRITALEASETRHTLEHVRASNSSLDEVVRKLQGEATEHQALAARFERQFHEAQESGRAEVHRTRMSLETEVEAANHQVNLVRAELEAEVSKVRAELEHVKMEADTAKARHDHLLDQEETVRREALRKVNHSSSVALDEARHKFESTLQDVTAQHTRALEHAVEDRTRAEAFLNERLALSDAKLQHFQDRVVYLEERLEVTKSAAQAAAQNAKGSNSSSLLPTRTPMPEKVSPQALRESILVLQEQLQERELRIERLQTQVEEEDATKLKERDDAEIAWLRELLAVRNEELTDLVDTISRPDFDRAMVRDTAIRIRANLQMEQQEKERSSRSPPNQLGSAFASLTSLATPKAAQFSSAFNKWRSTMESSALKTQQRTGPPRSRSFTPSKASVSAPPAGYHAGLMTPPASNLRSSPMPEQTNSLSPPRLHPRTGSNVSAQGAAKETAEAPNAASRTASATSDRPNTPLFRENSYDEDAADSAITMQTFEDDDLDGVADSDGPPAFRSLESELEEATASI